MQVVDGGGEEIEKKDPVACKEHKTFSLTFGSHAEPYQSYRIKTAITECFFLKVNLSSSILYFSSWVFL